MLIQSLEIIMHRTGIYSLLLLLFILLPTSLLAEDTALQKAIASGGKTYYRFCSICHGENAKGDGPYATNLRSSPPDLTGISAKRNGTFPWEELYAVISGDKVPAAHGSREMPAWGQQFDLRFWGKQQDQFADVIVNGRIFELMLYLQSIQEHQP